MLIRLRWGKSMCLAAKGRLQGWAAKLLLLWVGIFHFFFFQICNYVTAVSFFRLAYISLKSITLSIYSDAQCIFRVNRLPSSSTTEIVFKPDIGNTSN